MPTVEFDSGEFPFESLASLLQPTSFLLGAKLGLL